jgi:hypothetical protein
MKKSLRFVMAIALVALTAPAQDWAKARLKNLRVTLSG